MASEQVGAVESIVLFFCASTPTVLLPLLVSLVHALMRFLCFVTNLEAVFSSVVAFLFLPSSSVGSR